MAQQFCCFTSRLTKSSPGGPGLQGLRSGDPKFSIHQNSNLGGFKLPSPARNPEVFSFN